MELNKQEYEKYVKEVTPTHPVGHNVIRAMITGGAICTLGQFLTNGMIDRMGMDPLTASTWTSIDLVLISVILTGMNIYPKLAKWGGAGALVPITGFANSVVAPAIEFKSEGWVYGVGCKIFTIAGPVILYGVLTSWGLGIISLVFKFMV